MLPVESMFFTAIARKQLLEENHLVCFHEVIFYL
jgi:hypothetical protein